ncbi:hypothetical protein K443DRAFT_666475 [Laccaria amethystina LaAM-08-1]|uniref:Uncharacterized protein n=1 Tax=Laccaria amethystina LaAM-08-1 TaxID=1095629 RepID=A0A0C9X598_9AGAR|nr:hypothetical protein K443DRAFT_666475 [Laccaria amethystina LaAM-08-1]
MNALSRWTFVHRLARVGNCSWKSTSMSAPAAKPPSFKHPSFRCFQYLNLQYVPFRVMSYCLLIFYDCSGRHTCRTWKLLKATPDTPVEDFQELEQTSSPNLVSSMSRGYPDLCPQFPWSAKLK